MNLENYLHFGYLPSETTDSIEFRNLVFRQLEVKAASTGDVPIEKYIDEGVATLKRALERQTSQVVPGALHVIPLSGGLDSRAIFAALLQNVERNRIVAVTFGTPGTYDFDIGTFLAKKAGVQSVSLRLNSVEWQWDPQEIFDLAQRQSVPTGLFDGYVNETILKKFGRSSVYYWSGFMGDPLAGSHLPTTESTDWREAQRTFAIRNRFSRSISLTSPNYSPEKSLPDSPLVPREVLSYDEQIDFAIRQGKLIRPLVIPDRNIYRAPFLDEEWMRFITNVPRACRQGEILYREILVKLYPTWFGLPTKTYYGLPLTASSASIRLRKAVIRCVNLSRRWLPFIKDPSWKMINYIDFADAIRRRDDFRMLIGDSISDLSRRKILNWININDVWKKHEKGEDHAYALMGLAAAELFLKAGRL